MKVLRVFGFGFVSLCFLALAALFIWAEWANSHRIVPSPQNQSSFLKSYDPEEVIKKFRCPNEGFDSSHNSGAGSDTTSVRHTAGFVPGFTIQSSRKLDLMTALNEDVLRRFAFTNTRVLGKSVGSDGGVRYDYASGDSLAQYQFIHRQRASFAETCRCQPRSRTSEWISSLKRPGLAGDHDNASLLLIRIVPDVGLLACRREFVTTRLFQF